MTWGLWLLAGLLALLFTLQAIRFILIGNYVFGLYRHYKGGLYLVLCRSWESDNDAERVRRVLYFSLRELELDDRTETEFLSSVTVRSTAQVTMHLWEQQPRFERLLPPWQPEGSAR